MVYQIPPFLMGQAANVDFSPIQNALAQWRQDQRFNAQNALARDKLAMEQQQFANEQAREQEWKRLNQPGAAWARTLPAGVSDLARAAGPGSAVSFVNMLAQQPDLQLRRADLSERIAQRRDEQAHRNRMYPMQERQIEAQVRALEQKDPEREFLQNIFKGMQGQQQGQPPAAGPQPRLQPQSFEGGGGDPNLVLTQDQAQAAPQQQEMVDVPGVGRVTRQQAEQLRFALSKDRGEVLKDAINKTDLSKEARNKVDEQELNAINAIGRLKQIASGYQDKWLTYENKIKQYGLSWADSFETMRSKMKPEDVKELAEYTAWKRDAFEHLTNGIKEATGAAMGVQEEKRIRAGMPDPASDSPTQFKAKLVSSMRAAELSIQRTQFLRQNGFRGDRNAAEARMPLERFQGLLNDSRGLYKQLKDANPNADDEAIKDQVRRQIIRKYGIAT